MSLVLPALFSFVAEFFVPEGGVCGVFLGLIVCVVVHVLWICVWWGGVRILDKVHFDDNAWA